MPPISEITLWFKDSPPVDHRLTSLVKELNFSTPAPMLVVEETYDDGSRLDTAYQMSNIVKAEVAYKPPVGPITPNTYDDVLKADGDDNLITFPEQDCA